MSMEDPHGGVSALVNLRPIGRVVMVEKGQRLTVVHAMEVVEAGEGQGSPATCARA